ncbi:tetratricopeptide repeat protein [Nocardia sp. IFM 10818]
MRAGADAMARGDLGAALRIFEDAARAATGDVRVAALVNAAVVTDHSGDHAGAVARFREALGQMPAHAPRMRPGALIGLSQALQHLGDLDAAQEVLEQARTGLAADDAPGDLRFACGVSATAIALHRHQWARAIELANESLDAATLFAPEQAGHPLMNLAAAHFETGRWDLAEDFAGRALEAFDAAGDLDGSAETRQNLALMHTRSGRFDAAEPPLTASQDYFEAAGLAYRAGIGWKVMGFIAEHRQDARTATTRYRQALERFEQSGAEIDAADVRVRLATVACIVGDHATGEAELAAARRTYADRGLGLHCAQLDFWHAGLLEPLLDNTPALLPRALDLAVPAALALDAVRYELPDGAQRENWNRRMADPALRLAFRYAHLAADARLLADLIETICAGTTLDLDRLTAPGLPYDTLNPPTPPEPNLAPLPAALQLGTALAAVAASAGLPVTLPPRIAITPGEHIALDDWITAAEHRYGRPLRDNRVIPA